MYKSNVLYHVKGDFFFVITKFTLFCVLYSLRSYLFTPIFLLFRTKPLNATICEQKCERFAIFQRRRSSYSSCLDSVRNRHHTTSSWIKCTCLSQATVLSQSTAPSDCNDGRRRRRRRRLVLPGVWRSSVRVSCLLQHAAEQLLHAGDEVSPRPERDARTEAHCEFLSFG